MSFRLREYSRKLIKWLEVVGGVALVLMMVITGIDVAGIKLFLSPLPGSIDLVMYFQLMAISLAITSTYIAGRHIRVPFLILHLPRRIQAFVKSAIALLGLLLFSILVWQFCDYGNRLRIAGEYSPVIRLPIFVFAYIVALTCVPLCLILLLELHGSLVELVRGGEK
ncbi:MAG: TRAP transporter small permease [Candidatus Nezhaarchaeota archaeon]|nr:TRAP transporter small permease [Candidatus Nezhaarchaeota archaeon]